MAAVHHVLPSSVRPTHYHITLSPDLENATFSAEVAIDVHIHEPTSTFVLNAVGLTFSDVSVRAGVGDGVKDAPLTVQSITESTEDQRISVQVDRAVTDAAQLRFRYTAAISDNLFAFYRSHYMYEGATSYVGATQMCPAEARRVFPCWDEPSVKATFALDITVRAKLQVWSNDVPRKVVQLPDGFARWEFRPAMVMSTYVVAWVIGELETTEVVVPRSAAAGVGQSGELALPSSVVIRAVTPRGKVEQARFALTVAAQVLPLYEECFQFPYVFPKLDLIALPNFAFGAMENWGCITFREQTLLASEEASAMQKERVAMVVAHELAHQWFGNLATMAWWTDLWLNESFATYMATWAVNKIFPEWVVDTQFVHDEGSRAFQLDAMRSSHPIELPVRDVREVDSIFDAISYSKGAMVLRMAAKFVGEKGFQRGLVDYLSRYAYASATSLQLWEALSGPAAPNLKEVLHSWTREQGYPYVLAAHDAATGKLALSQRRFFVLSDVAVDDDAPLWRIPIFYTYGTAGGEVKTRSVVLADPTMSVSIDGAVWVKVNSNQIAFCRVQYTAEMLRGLVGPLTAKIINSTDRYSILADYAAFARGGYCDTVQVIDFLSHYHSEDDYTVWCEVAQFEKDLRSILAGSSPEVRAAFNDFCNRLYSPAMQRLGLQPRRGDGHRTQQARLLIFSRLLSCSNVEATTVARDLYDKRTTSAISPDMLGYVYAVHINTHGAAAMAEVQELIAKTTYAEERAQYLGALAAVAEPSIDVPKLMDYLLSDAVNSQDMFTVMLGLAEGAQTQIIFVQQLMDKWRRLAQKAPSVLLARMLKLVEHSSDEALVAPLRCFFDGLPEEMQSRTRMSFEQGLEGLLCNAAWAARDGARIAHYLLHKGAP
ncbi:aminopeptidase-like protein [Leishmania donovani]|uniref:Aminopeptidase n=1 Tax=Leishmania donovani TaxID=5661 RepID=E9BI42_LEIDO|nr:aminopeptidase-like protein [Leishmania donovani]TPP41081.1 Peptidase M1 family protein [Leishmania donovani]CBZ34918.1 aminopeptidase-like protein [Leishmania donovani]